MIRVLALTLLLSLSVTAGALEPEERLDDPVLEQRARDLSAELRCLVCPNQSIDDSNAPLARDLRVLVRERLIAGDSDGQVLQVVTARYGDYVLLTPPLRTSTLVLWFAGPIVLAVGALSVWLWLARRRTVAVPPLTADEQRRLDALLAAGDSGDGAR